MKHAIHKGTHHTFDSFSEYNGWVTYKAQDDCIHGIELELVADSESEAWVKYIDLQKRMTDQAIAQAKEAIERAIHWSGNIFRAAQSLSHK